MIAKNHGLPASLYIVSVLVLGGALLGLGFHGLVHSVPDERVVVWALLALMTIVVGRLSVRLPFQDCIVSFSDAFIFLTALLFGPSLATITGALDGYAASKRDRGGWEKVSFNAASMAVSVGLAARLLDRVIPPAGRAGTPGLLIAGLVLLASTHYILNTALVAGVVALSQGVSPLSVVRRSYTWAAICAAAGIFATALLVLVIPKSGVVLAFTVLLVPILMHTLYRAAHRRPEAAPSPSRG
jgi:hypothetical protein